MKYITFVFLLLCYTANSQIKINEVCPSNSKSFYDEEMDTPDWIELYNEGDEPVNLKDWRISDRDDFENASVMPDTIIAPGEYIVVFASGKDTLVKNYKISSNGVNMTTNNFDDNLSMTYLQLYGNNKITVRYNSFEFKQDSTNYYSNAGLILKENLEPNSRMLAFLGRHRFHKSFISFLRPTLHKYRSVSALSGQYKFDRYYFTMEVRNDTIINSVMDEEYNLLEKQEYHYPDLDNYYVGFTVLSNNLNRFYDLNISEIYLNEDKVSIDQFKTISFYDTDIKVAKERNIHTNFKLNADKEMVCLFNKAGEQVDSVSWENLYEDVSISKKEGECYYSSNPTPGNKNKDEYNRISYAPQIDKEIIITDSENVKIELDDISDLYYTDNYEEPTLSSKKFTGDITLNSSKLLKIKRIKESEVPSETLNLPVIKPSELVKNNINFLIFSKDEYLFNTVDGILEKEFSSRRAKAWQVIIDNSTIVFNDEIELRQSGKYTNAIHDQNSLRIVFNDHENANKIQENIFNCKSEFYSDRLTLRNSGNDRNHSFIRDVAANNFAMRIGTLEWTDSKTLPVIINSKLWGVYNVRDNIDEHYFSKKHNVKKDKINIINNNLYVNEGSNYELLNLDDNFNNLIQNYDEYYKTIDSLIDIQNLIDYLIYETFIGNRDWPENNIKAYKLSKDHKWRLLLNDLDHSFGLFNVSVSFNNLWKIFEFDETFFTKVFQGLIKDTKFKNRFLNRACDLLNHHLLSDTLVNNFNVLVEELKPLVPIQRNRWQESLENWESEIKRIEDYLRNRHLYYRQYLYEHFELPGTAELNLSTYPKNSGKFKLNTINIDTSDWSGIYFQDVPVTITAKPKHGYKFKRWNYDSLPQEKTIEVYLPEVYNLEAIYEEHDPTEQDTFIVVNEIMYSAHEDNDSDDWIEIYNAGQKDIDLGGWYVIDDDTSHTAFVFPENTLLRRGEYLILSEDTTAFNEVYEYDESEILIGEFDFGFGEFDEVNLFTPDSVLHDFVDYGNEKPWPIGAYGTGYTIELINPKLDNNVGKNWELSIPTGGTPFVINSVYDPLQTSVGSGEISDIFEYEINNSNQLNVRSRSGIEYLEVYDITGRLHDKINYNERRNLMIDLNNYAKGFYLFKFTINKSSNSTQEVIKILID